MQKVINTLWNHKIFTGRFVPKKLYEAIKSSLGGALQAVCGEAGFSYREITA